MRRRVREAWQVVTTLGEACGKVGRQYSDIAAAQRGETEDFAVGVWLAGLTCADFLRLKAVLPEARPDGVWDAVPPRRKTVTLMWGIEAPNAHRAVARTFEILTGYLEKAEVVPDGVRVEVDGVDGVLRDA